MQRWSGDCRQGSGERILIGGCCIWYHPQRSSPACLLPPCHSKQHSQPAQPHPQPHRGSDHCCRICCQLVTRQALAAAARCCCCCAVCVRAAARLRACRHRTAAPSQTAADTAPDAGARLCCTALLPTAPPPLPAADGSAAQARPTRAAVRLLSMAATSSTADPKPVLLQAGCKRTGRERAVAEGWFRKFSAWTLFKQPNYRMISRWQRDRAHWSAPEQPADVARSRAAGGAFLGSPAAAIANPGQATHTGQAAEGARSAAAP